MCQVHQTSNAICKFENNMQLTLWPCQWCTDVVSWIVPTLPSPDKLENETWWVQKIYVIYLRVLRCCFMVCVQLMHVSCPTAAVRSGSSCCAGTAQTFLWLLFCRLFSNRNVLCLSYTIATCSCSDAVALSQPRRQAQVPAVQEYSEITAGDPQSVCWSSTV